jgi:hypothetical protein
MFSRMSVLICVPQVYHDWQCAEKSLDERTITPPYRVAECSRLWGMDGVESGASLPPKRQGSANICTFDLAKRRRCPYIVDTIMLTLGSLGRAIAR